MAAEDRLRIYTDGACSGNPGRGGWAFCYETPEGVVERGGAEAITTNNRMEMRAAVEALKELNGRPGTVVTDSEYLRKGITGWIRAWKRNGWRTADGQPVKNQDLWRELDALNGPHVTWEWVRGHRGVRLNERCNQIAQAFSRGDPDPFGRKKRSRDNAPRPQPETGAPGGAGRLPTLPPDAPRYVSVVGGHVMRHRTWPECEAMVRGVSGARYRKCRNLQEERATLGLWGLKPPE